MRTATRYTKSHVTVKLKDLKIDPDVQRWEIKSHIDDLEADWDPMYVGTPVVSKRADGSLWLVDGQRRCKAGLRVDPEMELDVELHEGLSRQQEAQMFLKLNKGRRAPHPYDSYVVALTARERVETRVEDQLAARGLGMARSASANLVGAVQACTRIVKSEARGERLLEQALEACEGAWGREKDSWNADVLQGVAKVIHANRKGIDTKRLRNTLAKRRADQLLADAHGMAKGGGGSESRSDRVAEIVIERYNSGLRTESKKIAV